MNTNIIKVCKKVSSIQSSPKFWKCPHPRALLYTLTLKHTISDKVE